MSLAEAFLKVKIFDLSPPPSTCSFPGPWQASQPCHSGPLFVSSVVAKCGDPSKFLKKSFSGVSSWHVLHISEPTYCVGSVTIAYGGPADWSLFLLFSLPGFRPAAVLGDITRIAAIVARIAPHRKTRGMRACGLRIGPPSRRPAGLLPYPSPIPPSYCSGLV